MVEGLRARRRHAEQVHAQTVLRKKVKSAHASGTEEATKSFQASVEGLEASLAEARRSHRTEVDARRAAEAEAGAFKALLAKSDADRGLLDAQVAALRAKLEEQSLAHAAALGSLQSELAAVKEELSEAREAQAHEAAVAIKEKGDLQAAHLQQLKEVEADHASRLEEVKKTVEAETMADFSASVWDQLATYLPEYCEGLVWADFQAFMDRKMAEAHALLAEFEAEQAALSGGQGVGTPAPPVGEEASGAPVGGASEARQGDDFLPPNP